MPGLFRKFHASQNNQGEISFFYVDNYLILIDFSEPNETANVIKTSTITSNEAIVLKSKPVAIKDFREEDLFEDEESSDEVFNELNVFPFIKTEMEDFVEEATQDKSNKKKEQRINLNWCRGCGNHCVLKTIDQTLTEVIGRLLEVKIHSFKLFLKSKFHDFIFRFHRLKSFSAAHACKLPTESKNSHVVFLSSTRCLKSYINSNSMK